MFLSELRGKTISIQFDYCAYIDEAGDPGVARVAPIDAVGGTEWFTLGCVVIKSEKEANTVEYVKRVRQLVEARQRPDLHYRHLKPWHRALACSELAKEDLRAFVVVSNKQNMRQYRNHRAEAWSMHPNNWFYNYCIRILLERVSQWVERRSIMEHAEPRKVKLIFSRRGGHSYRHVETYTELLSIQSSKGTIFQKARQPKFTVLDHRLIEVIEHNRSAGLQMADIVASAFYNAANVGNAKNWDVAPAKLLKPRIAHFDNEQRNQGVTLLPWNIADVKLTEDQKSIFKFYGYRI